jgi:hypothetical protein
MDALNYDTVRQLTNDRVDRRLHEASVERLARRIDSRTPGLTTTAIRPTFTRLRRRQPVGVLAHPHPRSEG